MAKDYYPVLVRAAAALERNTDAARRALYDRARLTIMDAGLPPTETNGERAALEDAIYRVEMEIRDKSARSPSLPRRSDALATHGPGAARAGALPWARHAKALRLVALAGAAVLIIAALGYAVWPRRSAPVHQPGRAGVSAPMVQPTRSSEGSADPSRAYILRRQLVYYRTVHPVGTLIVTKSQHYMYMVRPNTAAMRYTIGIGRQCVNAAGLLSVSAKRESLEGGSRSANATQPAANPAKDPGADARFGMRSLALGDTGLRIDGAYPPIKDGGEGCIAMLNEDMIELYDRVGVGTRVVIN